MIKKGFTFAELMISLVVIAVITAILYPTISELAPNNNKHLFKSAYKTVELVVSELANSQTGVPASPEAMCIAFKQKLNFVPRTEALSSSDIDTDTNDKKCVGTSAGGYHFQTSNGMRWLFITKTIRGQNRPCALFIDVNAANNGVVSNCGSTDTSYIDAWAGSSDLKGSFCGNAKVHDTFVMEIKSSGRIEVLSEIGVNHLLGSTED